MFAALKAFFIVNQSGILAALAAVIFLAGIYTGTELQYTVERSREAVAQHKAEDARKQLADQLQSTVAQLQEAQDTIKRKQAALKAKVADEVKSNPAYHCPVPASAVQLLNQ